jgi:fucose permease
MRSSIEMKRAPAVLLVLSYAGFVSLGLPDSVLGAAWPAMRDELRLALDAAGWVVLVATAGTVLSSALSGHLQGHLSTGLVLSASTGLAAIALATYASAGGWPALLTGAACAGLGGGAVDAALNRFVAQHYSARHMNWLHGCWGVGATLGPASLAGALAAGWSWRSAYVALAGVEFALALAFIATRARWDAAAERGSNPSLPAQDSAPERSRPPRLTRAMRASVATFFVYCGIEASVGLWGASLLIETRQVSFAGAGAAVGFYWGMLALGRFALGALADRIGASRLLTLCCIAALIALVGLSLPTMRVEVSIAALGLLGLALAPIYPLVMHDTPRRHGSAAAQYLVGYQVAAGGLGIATLPWLVGLLGQRTSLLLVAPVLAALALLLLWLNRLRVTLGVR